jgi:ubiquinone/menaquinone biosynthesis C-methylase UbiE
MKHTPDHSHRSHQNRPGHGPAPEHDTGLAELLDLDAVLGAPVLALALDAASGALGSEPGTIIDLGAGTGTGSLALAARFTDAHIHSLDASPAMLDRLRSAAATAGVADRVEPHLVDLDGDWPAILSGSVDLGSVDLGSVDLVWAALSLHHVTSPERVLQQVMHVLRPGGVLVVMEMTGTTTFDPDDLGTGNDNLADRLVSALTALGYPVTAEWTKELTEAGFSAVQRFDTALIASAHTVDGAHFLELNLTRNRGMLSGDEDAGPHGTGSRGTGSHHHGRQATDDFNIEDLSALDAAIANLKAGASTLEFASGRAIWVAVRP